MKRITAKRFLFAMLAVAVSASFATAQENLLAGAIGTTVNSPEAFYNVWQVFDKDGRLVEDGFRKFSCFTQARVSESSKAAVYDDDPNHNIYGDHEAFSDGNYFIFMKFPDKSHVNAPHYYCYPINIKEEGDFLCSKLCLSQTACPGKRARDSSIIIAVRRGFVKRQPPLCQVTVVMIFDN